MSNPSFSNIDLWLFELAEGNLSPAQIEKLEMFLLQHPELDVERDVWEMARVAKKKAVYTEVDKHQKRRPIGWYAAGSIATAGMIILAWFMLDSGVERSGRLAQNNHMNSGVRVFVKHGTSSVTEFDQAQNSSVMSAAGVLVNQSIEYNNVNSGDRADLTGAEGNVDFNDVEMNSAVQGVEQNNGWLITDENSLYVANTSNINQEQNDVQVQEVDNNLKESENENSVSDHSYNNETAQLHSGEDGNASSNYLVDEELAINKVKELPLSGVNARALEPHEVHELEVLSTNDYEIVDRAQFNNSKEEHETFSTEYHMTMKMKMSRFTRSVQRMMDNPVALKNYRDPYYHVPGMLPTDVNFSAAGTMLSTRVQTLTRLQWYGQDNELFQNQLAIDGYVYGLRGGVGLQVNHGWYKRGGINVANVALTYSPKFSISKTVSLEPSLRFKMGNKSLTNSKMQGVSAVELERGNAQSYYPGETSPIGQELWYKDLGAGLMVNTEWFFAGVQMDNLFKHKDNIYQQDFSSPRRAGYHFVATFGTDWVSRDENLGLSPYVVYQNKENLSEAWLGANFRWHWFTVGASVSSKIEPAASIGMKFKHFALMYNADYTKSDMTGKPGLSQQVSIRFVSKPSRFGRRLLNL